MRKRGNRADEVTELDRLVCMCGYRHIYHRDGVIGPCSAFRRSVVLNGGRIEEGKAPGAWRSVEAGE